MKTWHLIRSVIIVGVLFFSLKETSIPETQPASAPTSQILDCIVKKETGLLYLFQYKIDTKQIMGSRALSFEEA